MTTLCIPKRGRTLKDTEQITQFLGDKGIFFKKWQPSYEVSENDSQEKWNILVNASDTLGTHTLYPRSTLMTNMS